MDNGGGLRRVVPIILILIVIAIAIAAMVSVGQNIFGGGTQPEAVNQGKVSLLNSAEDRSVRMTVRGMIVADETFNSYTITIKSTGRTMTTYNGYLDRQIETKQLSNNIPAYEQFVYALDRAAMMDSPELTGDANDTRGVCATGRLYEFETMRGNNTIKSLWTSTCDKSQGSLKASAAQLELLFKKQIPEYQQMLNKIKL